MNATEQTTLPPPATAPARRLSGRAGLLPWVLAGLFIATLWQTAYWTYRGALHELQLNTRHQLRLYVANLKGQLERYESLPQLLATNSRLVQLLRTPGDRERIAALNRYLETINEISNASDTYLMDAEGLTIAASNWQGERPFVGRNFSYRPYFKEAMRGRLGRYFALGSTSGRRGYYFAYPVRHDGEILGAVVIKLDMSQVEEAWDYSDSELIVTDPDGVIFVTTRPEWRYRSLEPLAADARRRILDSLRYPGAELRQLPVLSDEAVASGARVVRLDESGRRGGRVSYLLLNETMPEAGWKVQILTRLDPVRERVILSVMIALSVWLVLLLLVLYLRQRNTRISERARFEEEARRSLEHSERRVRAVIENTRAGLVTLEADGRIRTINPVARQLFGLQESGDPCVGRPFVELIDPGDRARWQGRIEPVEPDPEPFEIRGRRCDGTTFPVEIAVSPTRLQQGSKLIATIHDISDRKRQEEALREAHDRLEERVAQRTADLSASNRRLQQEIEERLRAETGLREAQDQLIQAAKLATLGQLSAGISHELNNPLAAIRTYADNARALLARGRGDDVGWNLEQISSLTERMAKIGSQLKAFARKTSGQLTAVPVTAALDGALAILGPQIRRIEPQIARDDGEPGLGIRADLVQLEQVLVNLIGNALQAVEGRERPGIAINVDADHESIRLTIADNGPGIDEAHLGRLFDPFFTTKESGLGLGLSISQRIVTAMGGALTAANRPGGGALFTLEMRRFDAGTPSVSDAVGGA